MGYNGSQEAPVRVLIVEDEPSLSDQLSPR